MAKAKFEIRRACKVCGTIFVAKNFGFLVLFSQLLQDGMEEAKG